MLIIYRLPPTRTGSGSVTFTDRTFGLVTIYHTFTIYLVTRWQFTLRLVILFCYLDRTFPVVVTLQFTIDLLLIWFQLLDTVELHVYSFDCWVVTVTIWDVYLPQFTTTHTFDYVTGLHTLHRTDTRFGWLYVLHVTPDVPYITVGWFYCCCYTFTRYQFIPILHTTHSWFRYTRLHRTVTVGLPHIYVYVYTRTFYRYPRWLPDTHTFPLPVGRLRLFARLPATHGYRLGLHSHTTPSRLRWFTVRFGYLTQFTRCGLRYYWRFTHGYLPVVTVYVGCYGCYVPHTVYTVYYTLYFRLRLVAFTRLHILLVTRYVHLHTVLVGYHLVGLPVYVYTHYVGWLPHLRLHTLFSYICRFDSVVTFTFTPLDPLVG